MSKAGGRTEALAHERMVELGTRIGIGGVEL